MVIFATSISYWSLIYKLVRHHYVLISVLVLAGLRAGTTTTTTTTTTASTASTSTPSLAHRPMCSSSNNSSSVSTTTASLATTVTLMPTSRWASRLRRRRRSCLRSTTASARRLPTRASRCRLRWPTTDSMIRWQDRVTASEDRCRMSTESPIRSRRPTIRPAPRTPSARFKGKEPFYSILIPVPASASLVPTSFKLSIQARKPKYHHLFQLTATRCVHLSRDC